MTILSIIFLLILSAFFSGSETAFFSLSKILLKKLENSDSKKDRRILRLLKNPRELLIIILLGNTIVNVAASSLAALFVIEMFPESAELPLIIEIICMTIILLVFGEITPKLLAFSSPEKFSAFSGFFLEAMKYALYPVIKILSLLSNIFTHKKHDSNLHSVTSEDFKNLISSDITNESLEEDQKNIIESIFRFSSTRAKEIMIPRVDICAVEITDGIEQVKEEIFKSGHSRIPVYRKNIDNIVGIVYAKDIILNPDKKTVHSLLRPVPFVTEKLKIQNLLNQFKNNKVHIAIIVDEYGGTSGLLTLEDILEELVGEILDEYDKEPPMFSKLSEEEFLINGMHTISELNQKFYLAIDEDEYDNLAEFCYDKFNRVPLKNESFTYNDIAEFTITDVDSNRINFVKMKLIDRDNDSEE